MSFSNKGQRTPVCSLLAANHVVTSFANQAIMALSHLMYCSGAADVVDLSQDQDQLAGPSSPAAKPDPTFGNDSNKSNSIGPGAEAKQKFKPEEAQAHKQSIDMQRSGRLARGRQEALQDASAVDSAAGGQQSTNKIHRHSKSGVEVEMEEI